MKTIVELSHGDINLMVLEGLEKRHNVQTQYSEYITRVMDKDAHMFLPGYSQSYDIPVTFIVVIDDKEYQVDNLRAIYDSTAKIKS